MSLRSIDKEENRRRMRNGELYYAFTPDLIADRRRCRKAYEKFNNAEELSRRALVEMWKEYVPSLACRQASLRRPLDRWAYETDGPLPTHSHSINCDSQPLPAPAATQEEDEDLLQDWPWIDGPIKLDYGYNVK